jgi:hypothetical protein
VTRQRLKTRKSFTVEEANAALPLVRAIVRDLTELSREVIQRRARVSSLLASRDRESQSPYREELLHVEEELEADNQRLRDFVEELLQLGVEPRSVTKGLVDFPTILDGEPAYLCWEMGEPEILYWHERGTPSHHRQPLTSGSLLRTGGESVAG